MRARRRTWRLLSKLDTSVVLLAVWSCLAVGDGMDGGSYSPAALLLVSLGTVLLVMVALVPSATMAPKVSRFATGAVLLLALPGAIVFRARLNAVGLPLVASWDLFFGAAAVALVGFSAYWILGRGQRLPQARVVHTVVLLLVVASAITMVQASPRPDIDVWDMLQATARGLVHGFNMYLQRWSAPPGEDTRYYSYLPGTTVILTPFWALFGDVRYGCIAALGAAALLTSRLQATRTAAVAGCLMVLVPLTTYAIELSWTEPILLVEITAMIFLVMRGRPNWAALCFAAALVTKQYAWVMIPFAAGWKAFGWRRTLAGSLGALLFMLPWVLPAWHAFIQGAIVGNAQDGGGHGHIPFYLRFFTLSVAALTTRHGSEIPLVVTVMVAVLVAVLVLRRLPSNGYGFTLGTATTLAAFDLFSPHTFFNQWWLVMCLVTVAIACLPEGEEDHAVFSAPEVQAGSLRPPLKALRD